MTLDHTFKEVISPNADTPYSFALVDLRAGPVVLTVPEVKSAAGGRQRSWTAMGVELRVAWGSRLPFPPTGDQIVEDMEFPAPSEGIILTHFVVSADVAASRDFYAGVLGGVTVMEGGPTIVKLANSWIIINEGGGPTEDKPEVILDVPAEPDQVSAFLNIRVADIQQVYDEWSAKGATFLTPPLDRGPEIRCYMRDPDGHLIEVGQATGILGSD